MNQRRTASLVILLVTLTGTASPSRAAEAGEARAALLERIRDAHGYSTEQMAALRALFEGSPFLGQGNPAVTRHPMTPGECRAKLAAAGVTHGNEKFEAICGARFMAPLYDPASSRPEDAEACIDQLEFPDVPCEFPVVWVRAREAAQICEALGKRLCDAHEWEGACEGSLKEPDYRFDLASGAADPPEAVRRMREAHNRAYGASKSWSYGTQPRPGVCAAASSKSEGCDGGGWRLCGSNTYPAGSFPECRSPLAVWDLHGNAAEHMNLPLAPGQMSSLGSRELGYTEMKGSWFIFDRYRAHEDWCRWRAPFWHGSRVMDPESHHNYHLGFRCCKTVRRGGPPEELLP